VSLQVGVVVVLVVEGKVGVADMVVTFGGRRDARILSQDTDPLFSRRCSMTSLS